MRSSLRFGVDSAVLVSGILGAAAGAEASTVPTPIAVTGWNRDDVIGTTNPYYAKNFYYNSAGPEAFVENGASSDTGGTTISGGLPTETFGNPVNFNSGYINSVTGGNTVFQFQPFDTNQTDAGASSTGSNNVLTMAESSGPNTGTLTLSSAAPYSSLAVLTTVAGGSGSASETGTYTITFSDTSTLGGSYVAVDWAHTTATDAYTMTQIVNLGSGQTGGNSPSWTIINSSYYLAETDINLSNVTTSSGTTASTLAIESITFTGATNSSAYTGIFALSGVPVPEPSSAALLGTVSLGFLARRRRR